MNNVFNLALKSVRLGQAVSRDFRPQTVRWLHEAKRHSDTVVRLSQTLANDCILDFEVNHIDTPTDWREEISSEIAWWFWKIGEAKSTGLTEKWFAHRMQPFPFSEHAPEGNISILDVGSGPRSIIGLLDPTRSIKLTSVDPLASAYNKIYKFFGIDAPRINFGTAESLSTLDLISTYDLVWAKNCLDHAYDVPKAMFEICKVLKPGGSAIMEHWRNEAEAQNYEGLHQWNIDIDKNDIIVWSKNTRILFDFEKFGLKMKYKITTQTKGTGKAHDWIRLIFTKAI